MSREFSEWGACLVALAAVVNALAHLIEVIRR